MVEEEVQLVVKEAVSVAILVALAYALPYIAILAALGGLYWLYTVYRDSAGGAAAPGACPGDRAL